MEAKVNFVVVGLFVLVLSAIGIGGVLWLSSGKFYSKTYDIYHVYMTESVAGLNRDASVKYRGVNVGRVKRIALAPGDVERVLLVLEIERGTPIKQDTVAVLRAQGLTGIAYVELEGGSREAPPLTAQAGEDYPVIRSGPSLMARLDNAATALLTNLNVATENLNALLDQDSRNALKQTLVDLQTVSRTLAARSTTIDAGVVNAARTMENAERLTADLPRLIGRVEQTAEALNRMSGEVTRAGANVNAAVDSARAEAGQFAGETLPEVHLLVEELRDLTRSLKRASEQLEHNPNALLFGAPARKGGPGEKP